MSLQIWLPLNGNLNNQGLSNVTITNNGATVDNSGKIGKCYLVDSSKRISFSSFSWMTMKPANNFSFSCWVKGTTTGWLFACSAWELRLCPEYIKVHPGGTGQYPATYNATFDSNTWYHLAFTWNGNTGSLLLYLNGIQVASSVVPSSVSYDISSTFNMPYDGTRYLNDVRIYDHCLSPLEVKQISQGLICHYKLSGVGGENLVQNSIINTTSSSYGFGCRTVSVQNGKTYTFSVNGHISNAAKQDGTKLSVYLYKSDWTYCPLILGINNETDTTVTGTFIANQTTTLIINSYSYLEQGTPGSAVTVNWYKIEEGSKSTPWCPNPSDALYSTLGFDDGIEYDCSGNGNHGTKAGDIAWSGDSARYSGSYGFDGNTNAIKTNFYDYTLDGIFTINMWFRKNTGEWSSKSYETLFGGQSGFEIESKNSSTNSPVIYAYSWGQGKFAYELDKWNMLTVVRTTSDTKWYLNGELKLTGTAGTIPSGNYYIGAWRTSAEQNYKGNISDFRIYATALSETDIKSLYNVSASIDRTGVLFCGEIMEGE